MIDILKRLVVPACALLLAIIAIFAGWWVVFLLAPALVAIGIYDSFQDAWTIPRNDPAAGRIGWLFHKLRPCLRKYRANVMLRQVESVASGRFCDILPPRPRKTFQKTVAGRRPQP